jgi:cytochrome P450
LDKIFFRKIAAKREQYMKYSKAQAMERTKIGTEDCDRKDFFYYLLNARDPETGRGFSKDELWGESNLFIIAGSDTTSTALASTFFYLAHNAPALATVKAEIRAAFQSSTEITQGQALNSCHFLRACIDEAMRLSPPVAGALPRTVLQGGLTIDERFIPAGTDVCVPHYAIHHNPAYFPSPFSFQPNRWLPDHAPPAMAPLVDEARSAFAPFSVGPRGCIGKGMAYLELSISLAKVLWEYEMRVAPGTSAGEGRVGMEHGRERSSEYQLKDTFTSVKNGPILQFRRREGL